MKITIEHYGCKYSTESEHDEIALPELLKYIEGLIRSVGYSFTGEIDIVDHINDYEDRD